jgi:hypothetical protein
MYSRSLSLRLATGRARPFFRLEPQTGCSHCLHCAIVAPASPTAEGHDDVVYNFVCLILKASGALLLPLAIPGAIRALETQSLSTANGGTDPYPIPWLDKNGSHNQPAGLNLEPSHIYHFKGRVARCSTFTGMGTDNKGNRIAFGSATTDYGLIQGEYWAGRATQQGAFTHI